jgi:hypothetical protein
MTLSICILYINYNNNNHEITSYQSGSKMNSSETGKVRVTPFHPMKDHRGSRGINPLIFTSALVKTEWSTSRPDRFNPGIELRYSLSRRMFDSLR